MSNSHRYKTLVSMPTFGVPPEMLERAVSSVLAQDHRELQLVVIADGEKADYKLPTDDRLVVFELPENRGPYFAQAVALAANPYPWYAPHGSDDWTDPDHLTMLHETPGEAVACGAVWWHHGDDEPKVHYGRYEVGVFATERLRAIGGYNPAERIGQDSLLLKLLSNFGNLGLTTKPTYHRVRRPGSLTTAPETKLGSPARGEMRARNGMIFRRVHRLTQLEQIRAKRAEMIPQRIADEVSEHTERLRRHLG